MAVPVLPAMADQPPGRPGCLSGQLPDAALLGYGDFRWLGLTIYQASLWSPAARWPGGSEQQNQPLTRLPYALDLRYSVALSSAQICSAARTEMARQPKFSETDLQRWHRHLLNIIPSVEAGQRLTGIYQPGAGSRFFFNDRFLAEQNEADFAEAFFGIWLSDSSSQPALRSALTGQRRAA